MYSFFKAAVSTASRIFNRETTNFVRKPRWTVVYDTHRPQVTEKYESLPAVLKRIASKPITTQQRLEIYYKERTGNINEEPQKQFVFDDFTSETQKIIKARYETPKGAKDDEHVDFTCQFVAEELMEKLEEKKVSLHIKKF